MKRPDDYRLTTLEVIIGVLAILILMVIAGGLIVTHFPM